MFMKNKKILLLLLTSIVFGCGFTTNYELEIKDDKFSEDILFTFDENIYQKIEKFKDNDDCEFIERTLVGSDIFAVNDEKTLYQKTINSGDISTVELKYDYTFDEFNNSKYINNCFSSFFVDETSKYYYIKAYGDFYCTSNGINQVKIKTTNEIKVNDMAKKLENNIYAWDIKEKGNNIEFKVYKDVNKDIKYLIYSSVALLIIFIGFMIKNKVRRINKI